jgi:hypothetical protein
MLTFNQTIAGTLPSRKLFDAMRETATPARVTQSDNLQGKEMQNSENFSGGD